MKISAEFTATIMENLRFLCLNTLIRFPNIEKVGKATIYVLMDLRPELNVETWVHFRNLTYYDPIIVLTYLCFARVDLIGLCRAFLKTDRAKVMIITVVNKRLALTEKARLQLIQSLLGVNLSLRFAMKFINNLGFTLNFKVSI